MGYYRAGMPNPLHDPRYVQLRRLLADLRVKKGLTQTEVARRLGKTQSYVSKYENVERRLDVVECADIAAAFEMSVEQLLRRIAREVDLDRS